MRSASAKEGAVSRTDRPTTIASQPVPGGSRPVLDGPVLTLGKRVVPETIKAGVLAGLRGYARGTASLRRLPDFLLIGAKRCGSTSLHHYLQAHPDVAPIFPRAAHRKGVHYFDRNPGRPLSWYRAHFPIATSFRPSRLVGDASTYYFLAPGAPRLAAQIVPHAKIIVLLRDPAERAFSHYRDEVKNGHETLPFASAIAAEAHRLAPELARMAADPHYYSFVHEHLAYLSWGHYAEHLNRWLACFAREQFLVLSSEALFTDPSATLRRVTDFLGLPPGPPVSGWYNAAPKEPHDDGTMRALRRYYAPHNERLVRLLGWRPAWA
jgi:hypothetical protein